MFTDAYKYREVENGIFYEVEGRVIVRIFLSFLFKMNPQMLHTHMTFHGFCTDLAQDRIKGTEKASPIYTLFHR